MTTVEHPSYYNTGKIEVIDFIEDQNLNFHLGNVIKYVCRAGKKDPNKEIEDLEKAAFYLERYITDLKNKKLTIGADEVLTALVPRVTRE